MELKDYPSQEYCCIERIRKLCAGVASPRYSLGIGDDAAVRQCAAGEQLVMTADIAIEGVHFSQEYMTLEEIGYRAMVANVSDCAAMGATPDSALVQLGFPQKRERGEAVEEQIARIYQGFVRACREWDFPIVGGDLSAAPCWTIAVSLTGRKEAGARIMTRRGARPGDTLWCTGVPGKSGAGLAVLQRWGREHAPVEYQELVRAHIAPTAMVYAGHTLADDPAVHCMIDLSDGMAKECRTLCHENSVGIMLDPAQHCLLPEFLHLGPVLQKEWREWFLYGGEDYHLLFAASADFEPGRLRDVETVAVGSIVAGPDNVSFRDEKGVIREVVSRGWDHISLS